MKYKMFIVCLALLLVMLSGSPAQAEDPLSKAAEIHEKALSDIIYIDSELIAIYYQNEKIIEILNDIRDVAKDSLEEMKKLNKGTEVKD